MFGFSALLAAIARLTASVNRMADAFEAGCETLEAGPQQHRIESEVRPVIVEPVEEQKPKARNGKARA